VRTSPTAPVQPRQKRIRFTGFVCTLCDIRCTSDADFQNHLASRRHREHRHNGERPPAAPSHVLPVARAASGPVAQLINILLLEWHGFAVETLTAMFLLRTQQLLGFIHTGQLARAASEEEFAALLLQQPTYIGLSALRARERLACVDLPAGSDAPTLRLSEDRRCALQLDCLHRRLLRTTLAENFRLLSMVAFRCVIDGTAAHLLSDDRHVFLSQLVNVVWESASLPGSPYHWAFHNRLRPTERREQRRRHSLSDLSSPEFRCDCTPRQQELWAVREELIAEFATWRRGIQEDMRAAEIADGHDDDFGSD
jgi:hypothetical protein